MITDWHFYAAAIPGTILLGLGKGGFAGIGMLALPLLSLVLPPLQAAAILLPILMVQDIVGVWAFRRDFSAMHLKLLFPGGMFGMLIGYFTASRVSTGFVLLLVGLIGAVFALYQFLRSPPADAAPRTPGVAAASFWSTICGFTSFIANAGGPPFQVVMLPQKLSPRVYAGTQAIYFAVINYVKFVGFIHLGQVSMTNLTTSAVLFPLAIVATLGGVWLLKRVSSDNFYRVVVTLTFLVGLKLIWDGLRQLGLF
ncbi:MULTISPECIES: sulfite exporter TauE/SafE family protein [unclassified Beijerinckia]|uniref:sulfite exporter TauE/SafE family protein n=1 Tax=unclassified Beijerinckia TaxID=2638183 RepID=UPI00089A4710|nr:MULTISPECIES: sulfite exporter TauE/SafE family protein [unclassified Beijerinckia]MDH7799925.1 putative membrane protein YfcA [Beijerinckia sp. GAS462]SED42728.1 hypothetical protein SAMN05443249_5343 [Beijerinckia sp. 28-YEA-48]